MNELDLYRSLSRNNNLSKSEMNVVIYCYNEKHTSKEIASYLGWKSPNIARLLIAMFNKGLLTRQQLEDKKTYIYTTDNSSPLLELE
ncbi:hypothetical protein [Brochothrix thermosphacta]|uniref:MarR family transcriptional regulator n=1 Tax=Brochothrix thermosphacta TaxID=2756 RepID=A0A1D2LNZ8_BROTH|nr:hypothetical protein [Brochothrix thermosphacta]ATF26259.1 hypothetical protein CNY62_07660 [Brochothrix thermosphacta]ATH85600.1 hypothetical protein CPF12_07255 [Brochothrix thermosphacta]MPQ28639.1 hypothetical protein [Brochothrix thermosphacta]ODJ68477.1 hypothetical protein BFR36_01420 [Brochothrix thermosphacta]ODJ71674.1 hypothetical protein BFR45_10515 [Brochothrix thermosphacta]